ncbi:MAG: helix-turn-helix domain-containing protein [Bacteroidota bacterium]
MTSTRLADEIGVQRSSISHILSGRNKPSYDFIHKFLQYYKDINPKWLILGEGPMYAKEKQTSLSFEQQPEKSTSPEAAVQKEASGDVRASDSREVEPQPTKSPYIEKIVIFYSDNRFEEYTPKDKK